jgi:hypothetical protein
MAFVLCKCRVLILWVPDFVLFKKSRKNLCCVPVRGPESICLNFNENGSLRRGVSTKWWSIRFHKLSYSLLTLCITAIFVGTIFL